MAGFLIYGLIIIKCWLYFTEVNIFVRKWYNIHYLKFASILTIQEKWYSNHFFKSRSVRMIWNVNKSSASLMPLLFQCSYFARCQSSGRFPSLPAQPCNVGTIFAFPLFRDYFSPFTSLAVCVRKLATSEVSLNKFPGFLVLYGGLGNIFAFLFIRQNNSNGFHYDNYLDCILWPQLCTDCS